MTGIVAFRLEREIRERAYDVRPGSEHAADVRASLMRALADVRESMRADDALRLEVLIERLTGMTR